MVKERLEQAAGRTFFVTGSGSGLFTLAGSEEEGGRVRESLTDVFEGLLQVVAPDGRPLSSPEAPQADGS
jgi:4-diphosphocytidyl-2C-methyl-D-erythritol kinase